MSPEFAGPPDPVRVLRLDFGGFPRVSPLNPRFVPGHDRLKLVVEVDPPALPAGITPAAVLDVLRACVPTLDRHRCGGDRPLPDAISGDPAEAGLDLAHLLEHLIIDFQHLVAGMQVCSGITCGHEDPRNRYDLFIETPDRRVGRLCAALASDMINECLIGMRPDPIHRKALVLAGHIYRNPASALTPPAAARAAGGNGETIAALAVLARHRFVRSIETTFNYSGIPAYEIIAVDDALRS